MHRYECVALCKDISLQRGRWFCARSLASCIPRSSVDRFEQSNPIVACTALRLRSAVQRHQSAERQMILRQIYSLMYPKIQRRQVIMNVLHPGCVRPPRWSPPVLWRRFQDGLATICVLIHSCKMPRKVRRRDLRAYYNCDSYTIRGRFERDSSAIRARHATTRYEVFRALRDRFEHSTRISSRRVLHVDW